MIQLHPTASYIRVNTNHTPPDRGAAEGHAPESKTPDPQAAHQATNRPAISPLARVEAAEIRTLKARDREVRQHERAHAAAAAGIPHSAPRFSFTRGPDGQLYAVGGEVQIDTGPIPGDPRATLEKAQQIQRAAMAPAKPSAQDRAVATAAAAMATQARAELQQERARSNELQNGKREAVSERYTPAETRAPQHIDVRA